MTSADASAEGTGKAAEASDTADAADAADTEPEVAPAEGVEIPKQQSAEEAADNEAGEGARK
ncbi:gliding motility protein [Streptomyces sp. NPDC000229]|uniref:gliding motility protein n=1 Tax=Streptomyces sp. NPDC000229 TaxID=3154247 RepID=UPI0033180015